MKKLFLLILCILSAKSSLPLSYHALKKWDGFAALAASTSVNHFAKKSNFLTKKPYIANGLKYGLLSYGIYSVCYNIYQNFYSVPPAPHNKLPLHQQSTCTTDKILKLKIKKLREKNTTLQDKMYAQQKKTVLEELKNKWLKQDLDKLKQENQDYAKCIAEEVRNTTIEFLKQEKLKDDFEDRLDDITSSQKLFDAFNKRLEDIMEKMGTIFSESLKNMTALLEKTALDTLDKKQYNSLKIVADGLAILTKQSLNITCEYYKALFSKAIYEDSDLDEDSYMENTINDKIEDPLKPITDQLNTYVESVFGIISNLLDQVEHLSKEEKFNIAAMLKACIQTMQKQSITFYNTLPEVIELFYKNFDTSSREGIIKEIVEKHEEALNSFLQKIDSNIIQNMVYALDQNEIYKDLHNANKKIVELTKIIEAIKEQAAIDKKNLKILAKEVIRQYKQ